MVYKDTGGPAFPTETASPERHLGISMRDYFAAKAMHGALSGQLAGEECEDWTQTRIAEFAYKMADAMLKARGA